MISGQVDRLRTAAQTYRRLGNHTAEGMFLEAADTITELRGALQVASVDYRHLQDENAKLRELVRDLWLQLLNAYDRKEVDEFADRMRELGVDDA